MLINELKLLLGLASKSLEVDLWISLSVAACIGPGTLCAQGLTRTLTGSVTFRLFQHTPVASILRQDMSMAHDAAPELLK